MQSPWCLFSFTSWVSGELGACRQQRSCVWCSSVRGGGLFVVNTTVTFWICHCGVLVEPCRREWSPTRTCLRCDIHGPGGGCSELEEVRWMTKAPPSWPWALVPSAGSRGCSETRRCRSLLSTGRWTTSTLHLGGASRVWAEEDSDSVRFAVEVRARRCCQRGRKMIQLADLWTGSEWHSDVGVQSVCDGPWLSLELKLSPETLPWAFAHDGAAFRSIASHESLGCCSLCRRSV